MAALSSEVLAVASNIILLSYLLLILIQVFCDCEMYTQDFCIP